MTEQHGTYHPTRRAADPIDTDATASDDAVAMLETAANDHVLIDDAMVGSSMLLDPVIATDDLSAGHHRSDWM